MKAEWNVVLGCPRSGTTFLMNALQALPYSECIMGQIYPLQIAHIVNQHLPKPVYQALARAFEFAFETHLDRVCNNRSMAVEKFLRRQMGLYEFIQAIRHRRKIERLIFKEPFFAFAPEFTYNALPECRIIHIYRDGRDCANSLVKNYDVLTDEKLATLYTAEASLGRKYDDRYVPWWVAEGEEESFLACSPYVRAVWMWKEMVYRCHNYFTRSHVIQSGRVMLLKYEDLMKDPLSWGRKVVRHLGGDFTSEVKKRFKKAQTRSIGIHRQRNPEEIENATQISRSELEIYGYL